MPFAKTLAILAVLTLTHTASAASIYLEPVPQTLLPGYTAYGIFWDGEGTQDWTSASLIMDLTQGTTYQHPFESPNGAPPPAAFIPAFPELAFDTHFGIIGDGSAGGPGCVSGPCLPEDDHTSLDAPHIEASWFNTASGDTGIVKIGNITLTNDAVGTWTLESTGMLVTGTIPIPEPTSLALFAFAGPALLRRRRNDHEPSGKAQP